MQHKQMKLLGTREIDRLKSIKSDFHRCISALHGLYHFVRARTRKKLISECRHLNEHSFQNEPLAQQAN